MALRRSQNLGQAARYVANRALPVTERERGRLHRVSVLDLSNLRIEDRGAPMHVAALLILDRLPRVDSGRLRGLAAVSASVECRLHRAPRLRQTLYKPLPGLGPPVWIDYPAFDIRQHLHMRPVRPPGDEGALLATCAELNQSPLKRSQPLWEIWLLTGLAASRAAVLIRLHHVLADGVAALTMLSDLVAGDDEPETRSAWVASPVPTVRRLAADRLGAGLRAMSGICQPVAVGARLRRLCGQAAALAREGRAPRVSFNVPVTGQRRLALVRADLELARAGAHAHGGTVNDVVLAAVAGGARRLLGFRGEVTPATKLKASVAVSLRGHAHEPAGGNRIGVMIVPLPVGETNSSARLTRIAAATAQRKRGPAYQPSSRLLQRWMVRAMSRQHLVNLLVSNLHGPVEPFSFAGARVLEMFQLGVVQGNVPISVGALSYAGQLSLAIVADGAIDDLDAFTAGVDQTLHDLQAS